jgi:hypothetical protein
VRQAPDQDAGFARWTGFEERCRRLCDAPRPAADQGAARQRRARLGAEQGVGYAEVLVGRLLTSVAKAETERRGARHREANEQAARAGCPLQI